MTTVIGATGMMIRKHCIVSRLTAILVIERMHIRLETPM
jgi:hypothetical protein